MNIHGNSKIIKLLKCFFSGNSVNRSLPRKSGSKHCTILK